MRYPNLCNTSHESTHIPGVSATVPRLNSPASRDSQDKSEPPPAERFHTMTHRFLESLNWSSNADRGNRQNIPGQRLTQPESLPNWISRDSWLMMQGQDTECDAVGKLNALPAKILGHVVINQHEGSPWVAGRWLSGLMSCLPDKKRRWCRGTNPTSPDSWHGSGRTVAYWKNPTQ